MIGRRATAPMAAAVAFLAVPLMTGPTAVRAQAMAVEAGVHTLSVGDAAITELVLPFGVSWGWSAVRFDLSSAWASASYTRGDVTSELAGLTDVTVRAMVPLLGDHGRLIVATNLPTGTAALSDSELPVAGVLTTDLLALPVRSFGSGVGVSTGLALARPVGDWVAGGIAVYRMGSAYEPVVAGEGAEAAEFRPGSELRLRLGLERPAVNGVTVRLAGSWSRFGDDQTEDAPVFSRGDRFMGEAVTEFPFRAGAAGVYGWTLYRSGSELLLEGAPQPVPSSALFGVGAEVTYPLTPALSLRPRLELTGQAGESGFGSGDGWIVRIGSGASYRVAGLQFEPAALIQAGGLEGEGVFGLVLRGGVLWVR